MGLLKLKWRLDCFAAFVMKLPFVGEQIFSRFYNSLTKEGREDSFWAFLKVCVLKMVA